MKHAIMKHELLVISLHHAKQKSYILKLQHEILKYSIYCTLHKPGELTVHIIAIRLIW